MKTLKQLAGEEAEKLGVKLGPEHSLKAFVYQGTTEKEARESLRDWIKAIEDAKKTRKK